MSRIRAERASEFAKPERASAVSAASHCLILACRAIREHVDAACKVPLAKCHPQRAKVATIIAGRAHPSIRDCPLRDYPRALILSLPLCYRSLLSSTPVLVV